MKYTSQPLHLNSPTYPKPCQKQVISKGTEQIRGGYSPDKTENPQPPSMSHLKPGRPRHSPTGPSKNQNKPKVGVTVALATGYLLITDIGGGNAAPLKELRNRSEAFVLVCRKLLTKKKKNRPPLRLQECLSQLLVDSGFVHCLPMAIHPQALLLPASVNILEMPT